MTIALKTTHLAVHDPELALTFYRDALGLEVRADIANPAGRWITLAAPGQDTSVVLSEPHAGRSQDDGDALATLLAKGSLPGPLIFSVSDLDETFEKLRASGAEVLQEPMDQPWGARDCALRDPSGNMVRFDQA
jgi:catechol 2,3-dioxygenase-like lactoylglutathione lyase family enzyme